MNICTWRMYKWTFVWGHVWMNICMTCEWGVMRHIWHLNEVWCEWHIIYTWPLSEIDTWPLIEIDTWLLIETSDRNRYMTSIRSCINDVSLTSHLIQHIIYTWPLIKKDTAPTRSHSCAKWLIATHCNTLQPTATHCNTLWHIATHCNTLWPDQERCDTHAQPCMCDMTYCDTLQHTATHCNTLWRTATHCDTLRHIATHCNTLQHTMTWSRKIWHPRSAIYVRHDLMQHTATHCNTLQHTATHYDTLQHTATHCNTLQHTTTHCNTLQHTATHSHSCATWLIHMTKPIHMCAMTHTCGTWLIHVGHDSCTHNLMKKNHSIVHMRHDSFIRIGSHLYVPWLIHMTQPINMCAVTTTCGTRLIHIWTEKKEWGTHAPPFMCDMAHSYVHVIIYMCHDSFVYATHCDTLRHTVTH